MAAEAIRIHIHIIQAVIHTDQAEAIEAPGAPAVHTALLTVIPVRDITVHLQAAAVVVLFPAAAFR